MSAVYTVEKAKLELKNSIRGYFIKDKDGNYIMPEFYRQPFFLVGAPGIGKTQLVKQVADDLGIGFVSCSITHHTRNTVLGLPVIRDMSENGKVTKYTEYTMSEIIAKVEDAYNNGAKEGILLIDEFASMAESLVAPMLAFLQTKNIGQHFLPEGWTVVLCSNPPEFNRTARKFDMAIMDRVRVMNIDFDKKDFINYAEKSGMHQVILQFLKNNPSNIYVCRSEEDGSDTIVTTRGWENLSFVIKSYEATGSEVSQELIRQIIKSDSIAYSFFRFYCICISSLSVSELGDILNGKGIDFYAQKHADDDFKKKYSILQLIESAVEDDCRQHEKRNEFLKFMGSVLKELKKHKNNMNICEMLNRRAGNNPAFRTVTNGMEVIKSWQDKKADDMELESLREIMERVNAGNSDDLNQFISEDGTDNQFVIDIFRKYLAEETLSAKNEMQKANAKISHAIEFVKKIDFQDNISEAFISMLNQHPEILSVLSHCNNPEYAEECGKLYEAVNK